MAGTDTAGAAAAQAPQGTPAAAAPAATPAPTTTPMDDAAARRAATKAAVLAGAAGAAKPPIPATAAPSPTAGQPPGPAAAAPAAAPPAEPATPAASAEPAEHPGMAQVRKAEQHARRQLATERAQMQADFETQRATWQQRLAKADEIDAKISNARRDPIPALQALGFTEHDFDGLGRLVYAHSPEGKKDPRAAATMAQARQMLEQREANTKVDKLETELRTMRDQAAQAQQQQHVQAQIDAYAGTVTAAISDEHPLAKVRLAADPAAARNALLAIADQLYNESGPSNDLRDVPTPADVLQAYERRRTAELERLRPEYEALARPAAAAPAASTAAATTDTPAAAAPAGAAVAAAATPGPTRLSREELLAGIKKLKEARGQ